MPYVYRLYEKHNSSNLMSERGNKFLNFPFCTLKTGSSEKSEAESGLNNLICLCVWKVKITPAKLLGELGRLTS